jgi:hypothetical protein
MSISSQMPGVQNLFCQILVWQIKICTPDCLQPNVNSTGEAVLEHYLDID